MVGGCPGSVYPLMFVIGAVVIASKRRSPIHGYGLFADITIARGQSLGIYTGQEVEIDQENIKAGHVLYRVDENGEYAGARLGSSPLKWINHSSRPNVAMRWETWEFYATRRIKAGEEILFDYGEDWLAD